MPGVSFYALKSITNSTSWQRNSFLSKVKKEENFSKDIKILSAKTKEQKS